MNKQSGKPMSVIAKSLQEAIPKGYMVAYRILGSHEESQDACQEAATKAWSARKSYDPGKPFYPWFYRILKNHCFDRLKDRKKRGNQVEKEVSDTKQSAETQFLESERASMIARAVEELPDDLREIIELRHFQDLSYEEMAEVLEYPIGTVMSKLYRARKRLKKLLKTRFHYTFDESR